MSASSFPMYVSIETLTALGELTGHFWADAISLEPRIDDAIRHYISSQSKPAPAANQPSASLEPARSSEAAGYQWKQLFLPQGTKLRASFGKESYFAAVMGDQIKCGEQSLSPSAFANLKGCGNRNAWKAIWLLLPGSEQWLLADVVRASRHTAIARLFGDDVLLRPEGAASGHGSRHIAFAVPRRLGQLWDAVARRVRYPKIKTRLQDTR